MKILVSKLKIIRKRYEFIPLDQETALYFWYKIIIHPDEATDSSVYSRACFHDFLYTCCFEEVVCENIGCAAQIIRKKYESIPLIQDKALYFWYNIIIHPDEATDLSGSSKACFHDFLLKCCF